MAGTAVCSIGLMRFKRFVDFDDPTRIRIFGNVFDGIKSITAPGLLQFVATSGKLVGFPSIT